MVCTLGYDLAPGICGWAAVSADFIEAGAFQLPPLGNDLGTLLAVFEQHHVQLEERFCPALVAFESPIMRKWDSLIDVRKIYSLGAFLEYLAIRSGLPVHEVDLRAVKSVMTGDAHADKALVVKAARRLGVILPAKDAEGRKDAADAVGVALETTRLLHPEIAAPFLAILQGSLL